jgi:RHS repeat-associated protein
MVEVVDPLNSISSCEYDNSGNVISQTDPNGGSTSFEYDSMGRITAVVNAIGSEYNYTYNASGLLTESENGRNQKSTYIYDATGRITSMTDEVGTIYYTYDNNGNLLTVQDENGTISRQYDELNRVTAYTDHNGKTVKYSYDELGNLISLTYPGGEIVRYSYNLDSSLHTVTDWDARVTVYGYDANSRLTSVGRPDGSYATYGYNAKGQLISQDDINGNVSINSYHYEYDTAGNITGITDSESINSEGLNSVSMTYDAANRLITYNGQNIIYDADGNMTYGPLNGIMTEFEYDCRNRLIRAGSTTYEYDAENHRTAVNETSRRMEYMVDPNSMFSQILDSTVYEATGDGQYSATGSGTLYVYGLGLIGEESAERGYLTYHFNQVGSTTAITNESGDVIRTYTYGPYGELLSGDRDGIQFLYNGQYGIVTDANGLYQMRSRYYNPDIKRFINQDVLYGSITDSQSMNRYSYVQGNPINALDPFGLFLMNMTYADMGHALLNIIGFIPGIGEVADLANAIWYFVEGFSEGGWSNGGKDKILEGISSLISALPLFGSVVGAGLKIGFKSSTKAIKAAEIVETVCSCAANTYELYEATTEVGEGIGSIIYDTQVLGKNANASDVAKITLGIISGIIAGRGLNNDLSKFNKIRDTELTLAYDNGFVHNNDVGIGGNQSADGFDDWLNKGEANNTVYNGITREGEAAYTGITKQTLEARRSQHNYSGKDFLDLNELYPNLTRNQARSIEQFYITNEIGSRMNKINSISPNSPFYQGAMQWAEEYLTSI